MAKHIKFLRLIYSSHMYCGIRKQPSRALTAINLNNGNLNWFCNLTSKSSDYVSSQFSQQNNHYPPGSIHVVGELWDIVLCASFGWLEPQLSLMKDFPIGFHQQRIALNLDPNPTTDIPGWDIVML